MATDSDQLVSESLRGTVVNLDSEVDHPAEDISYGQRRPKTGLVSSSEPTILPSNALRLHLEEPPTPLATSHESVYARSETPIVNHHLRPSARVRFRSRVRITSGFSRHRHKSDPDDLGSSRSGSPSSSISAPLRSHADDNTNAWGTLGQRVGLLALQKKILGPSQSQRRHRPRPEPITSATQVDERTPLRGSFPRSAYVEGEGVQDGDISDEDSDDERLAREVDDIFGTLPGRLLNRHVRYRYFSAQLLLNNNHLTFSIGGGSLNHSSVAIMQQSLSSFIMM